MRDIITFFLKFLFFLGIPFSIGLIYIIFNSKIEVKSLKIESVKWRKSHKNSSTNILELEGITKKGEKKVIEVEYDIKKNYDGNPDSLKYLLPDGRTLKIGSRLMVWDNNFENVYIKYQTDSKLTAWLRINYKWVFGLLFLNLYLFVKLIRIIKSE